jgi:hypothetical protein
LPLHEQDKMAPRAWPKLWWAAIALRATL